MIKYALLGLNHPRKPRGYQPGQRDNFGRAIFSGESLLQELESPWELTLTEPVPALEVNLRPKISLAQKYPIVPASSPWVSENELLVPSDWIDRHPPSLTQYIIDHSRLKIILTNK